MLEIKEIERGSLHFFCLWNRFSHLNAIKMSTRALYWSRHFIMIALASVAGAQLPSPESCAQCEPWGNQRNCYGKLHFGSTPRFTANLSTWNMVPSLGLGKAQWGTEAWTIQGSSTTIASHLEFSPPAVIQGIFEGEFLCLYSSKSSE